MRLPISSQKQSRGFTLVELLVAMFITIIIVSITVSIAATALDSWRGARAEISASRQAKIMLDTMAQDLESMVTRSGNRSEWLRVKSDTEEVGPEGQPSPNSAKILFYTTATDRYDGNVGNSSVDQGGDVSLVAYQLNYGDPIFGDTINDISSTFVLYRDLIEPNVTFTTYLGSEDLDASYQGAGIGDVSNAKNYVCENIYEMSLTFIVEYEAAPEPPATVGVTERIRIPVMGNDLGINTVQDFAITGSGLKADGSDSVPYSGGRVISADISVTVLTDAGLQVMKNNSLNDPEAKSKFIAKNSYQFTKSVQLSHQ